MHRFFHLYFLYFLYLSFLCVVPLPRPPSWLLNCIADVDECAMGTHGCSDGCINTEGSYTCTCKDSILYKLDADGKTCVREYIPNDQWQYNPVILQWEIQYSQQVNALPISYWPPGGHATRYFQMTKMQGQWKKQSNTVKHITHLQTLSLLTPFRKKNFWLDCCLLWEVKQSEI